MKKRGVVSAETKERIINVAKKEFAVKGFTDASLRDICAKADVTTGAVYFFFHNKDDLFNVIVNEVFDPLNEYFNILFNNDCQDEDTFSPERTEENYKTGEFLINLFDQKREVCRIIIANLKHKTVEDFLFNFRDKATKYYLYLLNSNGKTSTERYSIDEFSVHQFVHMQVDTILSLVSHDFSYEEMKIYMDNSIKMLRGALCALLK